MAVCYIHENYDVPHRCVYCIKKDMIEVDVEYDIGDEIETENGIRILGDSTRFKERDILIVDSQNKNNFLLKDAYFAGRSSVYGTPDGGTRTKFQTRKYFEHVDYEKLANLQNMPKVTDIRIYSKAINELIGYPSLRIEDDESEYKIILSRKKKSNEIELNKNGIKKIRITDDWTSKKDGRQGDITIGFYAIVFS